jgi:hypothetical protein
MRSDKSAESATIGRRSRLTHLPKRPPGCLVSLDISHSSEAGHEDLGGEPAASQDTDRPGLSGEPAIPTRQPGWTAWLTDREGQSCGGPTWSDGDPGRPQ